MSEFTDKLKIVFPSEFESEWFEKFKAFANAIDLNLFAGVADRNIVVYGGGDFEFKNNAISWTNDLFLRNFAFSTIYKVVPRTVIINDNEALFVKLNRSKPRDNNIFISDIEVRSVLLLSDGVELSPYLLLCFRFGSKIVFRNGRILELNTKSKIFEDMLVGGGGAIFFIDEDVSGQVDGTNTIFRTALQYEISSLSVYVNGLRKIRNEDFVINSETEFQFISTIPQPGDRIIAHYLTLGGAVNNMIWEENLTNQIDGSRTIFTVQFNIAGTNLFVWLNGQRLVRFSDYNFVLGQPRQFQLIEPPIIGDRLVVQYLRT